MLEEWMTQVVGFAGTPIPTVIAFIIKIVLCILIYVVGAKVISWLTRHVHEALRRSRMQEGAVTFTCSIVKILLYFVLVMGIAMQFGVTESSVAALVASAGVAIGLALQGGLSNLVGGFLILIFQPFQVGDYIITQEQEGTVQKIEIMYTTLQTADTRRVIVPNGTLADNVIVNVTAADRRKLEVKVSVSYEDNLATAKNVLERLILGNPDVLHEEEHLVFVAELGDSGVTLGLRCWVPTDKYLTVLWWMNEQIKLEFDRIGIRIPYPQLDVHVQCAAVPGAEQKREA